MSVTINMKKMISKSVRKFIRAEKARIRREFTDLGEQEKRIGEIVSRFRKPVALGNLAAS